MSDESAGRFRSSIVGDLNLPDGGEHDGPTGPGPDPEARVPMLVELNVLYPGGLDAVRSAFYDLWHGFADLSGGSYPRQPSTTEPAIPAGLALVGPKLYQCVLSRRTLRHMVDRDQARARDEDRPPAIFRVWPDYQLEQQIDRSAPTVKADAAWASYGARGRGIVWAVVDSGLDGSHPHFSRLEVAAEAAGAPPADGLTANLHRDFTYLVQLGDEGPPDPSPVQPGPAVPRPTALIDDSGHGTHVAGIIAGRAPDGSTPAVAVSKEQGDGGFVTRQRVGTLSGMAPECELVSIKVMRLDPRGNFVTSSAAVIRALNYLRNEVNVDPAVLRVHGVNLSLGCEWSPRDYASGQSPLCQAVNQLVAAGVVVVVSAGNLGARSSAGDTVSTSAALGSITEPAHAEDCIAVGSTHRDAPYSFGVTWTSSKGPTLDGRMKPDVIAPGEWITSAATGRIRAQAGLPAGPEPGSATCPPCYAEQSGTSMAAPHVSGVIAAFLSARPEFIGRPRRVKQLLMDNATDLGRERYAQGAGLVDLMRMLSNV
ncbi:S8 family peptidase [Nocardioides insulae]|uniref:S8 family peptidase n=1 Tax=Nocardioides insulae TaxID=394734 RepID=UPI000423A033|nr:S8 family peptidase [Nocardioides insulae]